MGIAGWTPAQSVPAYYDLKFEAMSSMAKPRAAAAAGWRRNRLVGDEG